MQHTLVAVFDNRADAQRALDDLLAGGFSRQEVRLSEGETAGSSTASTGSSTASTSTDDDSIGSSIKNFFGSLFGSDADDNRAQMYSTAVSSGQFVLTVVASNEPEVERAADIVERHGPIDIDEHAAQWSGGAMSSDAMRMGSGTQQQSALLSSQSTSGSQNLSGGSVQGTSSSMQGSQQRATAGETAIPVIQEELKVGKREVQRGGVRIYQRMVETPVSETVSLRDEHVNVERRPVDQPISSADMSAFQEKSIELRETAEEAVVEKTARVVEEVVVSKDTTQREESITDTVRHTEVDVTRLSPEDDTYYRSHWTSNFANQGGTYDEYAPAYSYGSSLRSNDAYRGKQWDEIEPTLRSDWEQRNPGSAWEKMKSAVRHGWERMTS